MHRNPARADNVITFIEKLPITIGEDAGKRFVLRDWQKDFIRDVYEPVRPHANPAEARDQYPPHQHGGKRAIRRAIFSLARKQGKALALDTPIPTPKGFRSMGDLAVGDQVFDENGERTTIVAVTDTLLDRPCYRLTFADGATVIADENHQWRVWSRLHATMATMTTGEMVNFKHNRKLNPGENLFAVDIGKAFDGEDADLAIPPYTFGAWLGDGACASASITTGGDDAEHIIQQVLAEGVPVTRRKEDWSLTNGRGGSHQDSYQYKLRELGVLHNKHIPGDYLFASRAQRMALLQGLMDTDGHATKAGQCEIVSVYPQLAQDIVVLIRGLGFKASIGESRATINGQDYGPRWRIQFYSYADRPVFRLPRKLERLKPAQPKPTRSSRKYIIKIESIESVPVRCIQVDSPNHLFLFGHHFTPTHNSELAAALILATLIGPEAEPNGEIYSAANDREQAAVVFNAVKRMVEATPALQKFLTVVPSTKTIFVKRSDIKAAGSKFRALSADAGTKHGLNPSMVIYDELAQARSRELFDVLATSMGARSEPLLMVISTQSDDPQHVLSQMIDDGLTGADPATVCHLHAAPDDCDIMDETAWYAANPALGDFRDLDEFRTMAERANRLPSEEAAFRLLYLNQRVSSLPTLTPRAEWEASKQRHADLKPGDPIYLGLDLSQTTDLTALVAVSAEDHSRVKSWFWKPAALIKDHTKRDAVPYDLWANQGHLIAAPGKVIDPEAVARHIVGLASIYEIVALAYDRYGIAALLKEFDKLDFKAQEGEGDGLRLVPWGQGFASMAPAVTAMETAILTEDLSHDANPVLTRCVMNAVVISDPAGNRKLDKSKSTGRIDGAVALAMAMGLKAKDRPDEKPKVWNPWDDPNFSLFA